jgi:hypothetical protein
VPEIDPLNDGVGLSVSLVPHGIDAKAKSRFISAIDGLLGNLVDIPGAWASGVRGRMRARNKTLEQLIEADASAAVKALSDEPEAGQATLHAFLAKECRRTENQTAILLEAKEELLRLPPPHEGAVPEADDSVMDPDWLNVFGRYAEDATSDRMRTLWARILAGEAQSEGTFSLTTLRIVSELDRKVAVALQNFSAYRISGGHIAIPNQLEGDLLAQSQILEDAGLVSGIGTNLRSRFPVKNGFAHIFAEGWALRVTSEVDVVEISALKLTRAAMELSTILPYDGAEALRRTAPFIRNGKAKSLFKADPIVGSPGSFNLINETLL